MEFTEVLEADYCYHSATIDRKVIISQFRQLSRSYLYTVFCSISDQWEEGAFQICRFLLWKGRVSLNPPVIGSMQRKLL